MFTRARNWVTDKANAINPQASLFDQEDDNFATGLNNCVTKDGQNKPSATMDWNNQRLTNVGAATARTDAPQTAQIQDGGLTQLGGVAGTDTITGSLTPAITAYTNGMRLQFVPAATNTGAATLNVNSVAARSIIKESGVALVAGDLVSGVPATVVYDLANTRWLLSSAVKVSDATLSSNIPVKASSNTFAADQSVIYSNAAGAVQVAIKNSSANASAYAQAIVLNDSNNNVVLLRTSSAGTLSGQGWGTGAPALSGAGISVDTDVPFCIFTGGVMRLQFSGTDISTRNVSAAEIGYKGVPQNSQSTDYTAVLTDAGKEIYQTGATKTVTIPANGSVAFSIGTVLTGTFTNASGGSVAITTDTMTLAGTTTTGTRTVAQNGIWVARKETATTWLIGGPGVS